MVVHGGGKAITRRWSKRAWRPRFVQGRRYTDDATLEIVARVLAEEINADIVRHINKFGGRASGLHHKTHQCLFGRRLTLPDGDGERDRPGPRRRGDRGRHRRRSRTSAWPASCRSSLAGRGRRRGGLLNVNADTAAAAVAMALEAEKLVFLTDTPASSATGTNPAA